MGYICDLHVHSHFSDGTFSPSEIITAAKQVGLHAVALCDHNTVDGLPSFLKAAEESSVRAIPGAEFSVNYNGKELHLLALFIESKHFAKISEMMLEVNELKEKSNILLYKSLVSAGYELDYATIKAQSPTGKINRAHFAAELMKLGYVSSVSEAFSTILTPEAGHYSEPERLDFFDMISFIRSINAAPVLAHPFLDLDEEELIALLPQAKESGLLGMECAYSRFDKATTKAANSIVKHFGLLPSGGSDFHGKNKPDISLGTGLGNLSVPFEWALALKEAAQSV